MKEPVLMHVKKQSLISVLVPGFWNLQSLQGYGLVFANKANAI